LSWSFDLVAYIPSGEEQTVSFQHMAGSQRSTSEYTRSVFMPKYAAQPHEMKIKFEDTEGGKYWISINIYKSQTVAKERFEIGSLHYEEGA
jgi:hypothetical protein